MKNNGRPGYGYTLLAQRILEQAIHDKKMDEIKDSDWVKYCLIPLACGEGCPQRKDRTRNAGIPNLELWETVKNLIDGV